MRQGTRGPGPGGALSRGREPAWTAGSPQPKFIGPVGCFPPPPQAMEEPLCPGTVETQMAEEGSEPPRPVDQLF